MYIKASAHDYKYLYNMNSRERFGKVYIATATYTFPVKNKLL